MTHPLSDNAIAVYRKLYFSPILKEANPSETHARVAKFAASAETNEKKHHSAEKAFSQMMEDNQFRPNTPTMLNAGLHPKPQTSACFSGDLQDDMYSILDFDRDAAIIYKSGSGIGGNYGMLRETNAILSTGGRSSGPFAFLRKSAMTAHAVKSGGSSRRAAHMAMMMDTHPDLLKFITIKADSDEFVILPNGQKTPLFSAMNLSIAMSDAFMKAIKADGKWELRGVVDGQVKETLPAKWLFEQIYEAAWKNGDPGVWFIDRANADNTVPSLGRIVTTNPCVAGDTLVSTSKGLIQIADLAGHTHQILVDSRFNTDNFLAAAVFSTGEKPVFKLTTVEGYEVKVTEDHRFMTADGWVQAKDLKKGQKLHIGNMKGGFGTVGTLEEGQTLGWFVGDGWFNNTRKDASLGFWGQDKSIADKFAAIVTSMIDGKWSKDALKKSYSCSAVNIEKQDMKLVLSQVLYRILQEEYGLDCKNKYQIPSKFLSMSEDFQRGFLQGLFSADGQLSGTIEKGINVRLTSISLSLLKQTQRMLLNFGLASKIYQNRKPARIVDFKDGHGPYHCKPYHDLMISKNNLTRFATEIGFLNGKNKRLIGALNSYGKRGAYKETFDVRFDQLIPEGSEPVFDLAEPKTYSFIANGFVVHNCGEQSLLPRQACGLGSINAAAFVRDGTFNWHDFETTVRQATRFLDNSIDLSGYPTPDYERMAFETRPIGLGIMGLADALILMELKYDSNDALVFAETLAATLTATSIAESVLLAQQKGAFPLFTEPQNRQAVLNVASKFITDDAVLKQIEKYGIRNSHWTTIAPTGTTSISCDCSQGMEPLFAICYDKTISDSREVWTFVNPIFEQRFSRCSWYPEMIKKVAKNHGSIVGLDLPAGADIFITAHDIHWKARIDMQAALQKGISNAISSTINLPNSATPLDIAQIYMYAWEKGLKGITVYRDGCKDDQPVSFGSKSKPAAELETPNPAGRPKVRSGFTHEVKTGHGKVYLTVNCNEQGLPMEIFTNGGKNGSVNAANLEAMARLVSIALQEGVEPERLARTIENINDGTIAWDKFVETDEKAVPIISVPDAIGKVLRRFYCSTDPCPEPAVEPAPEPVRPVRRCEACNSLTYMHDGCEFCPNCGSKCG